MRREARRDVLVRRFGEVELLAAVHERRLEQPAFLAVGLPVLRLLQVGAHLVDVPRELLQPCVQLLSLQGLTRRHVPHSSVQPALLLLVHGTLKAAPQPGFGAGSGIVAAHVAGPYVR